MSNESSNGGIPESNGDRDGLKTDESTAEAVETLAAGTRDAVPAAGSFDSGTLFEVLADPGRRYILTYLLQSEGAVACTELIDYVVNRTDHTMTRSEFRERVVAELTQDHLPKLDEYGYVQYNMERQIVGPTDLTPLARPYLRLALAHQQVAQEETEK